MALHLETALQRKFNFKMTTSGTIFDNFLFSDDLELAKEIGEGIKKTQEGEKKMTNKQDELERAKEKAEKPDDEDDEDLDDDLGDAVPTDEHDEL